MQHSLFYDWFRYFLPFMLSGAAKAGEEDGYSLNELMTPVFVEQLSFCDLLLTFALEPCTTENFC